LQAKPENFTSLYARALPSERAKVPLLEILQDKEEEDCSPLPIPESMVVLEYLEDLVDAGGTSATERATARLFAQMFSSWLSYIPILKADTGSPAEAEALQELLSGMDAADDFLRSNGDGGNGPFLLGERFSLAEMATAPFALRFLVVLPGLRPELEPLRLMEERKLDRLRAWMAAVRERPSCVGSLPAEEDLVEGYKKLLQRMAAAPTK